jgi:uncharacterized protein (TIRG00374 family)
LLGSRRNRTAVGCAAAAGWLADAACLWLCLRAVGDSVAFEALFIAYVAGALASLIPFLPGGLGAVEVAVPVILHRFGVDVDTALAATLAWRGIALVAPAVIGAGALMALRRNVPDGPG